MTSKLWSTKAAVTAASCYQMVGAGLSAPFSTSPPLLFVVWASMSGIHYFSGLTTRHTPQRQWNAVHYYDGTFTLQLNLTVLPVDVRLRRSGETDTSTSTTCSGDCDCPCTRWLQHGPAHCTLSRRCWLSVAATHRTWYQFLQNEHSIIVSVVLVVADGRWQRQCRLSMTIVPRFRTRTSGRCGTTSTLSVNRLQSMKLTITLES